MLKFVIVVSLLASPAMAGLNLAFVSAEVNLDPCGPVIDTGTSFAAESATCRYQGYVSYGSTEVNVGVGLDGIGVSMSGVAEGYPRAITVAKVSWSQDFVLSGLGAVGTGFVLPVFMEPAICAGGPFLPGATLTSPLGEKSSIWLPLSAKKGDTA